MSRTKIYKQVTVGSLPMSTCGGDDIVFVSVKKVTLIL